MICLGIDIGTTLTKASVYDSEQKNVRRIVLNPDQSEMSLFGSRYAMPTAIYISNDMTEFKIGTEAINLELSPNGVVYRDFKMNLDYANEFVDKNQRISYCGLVAGILMYVYRLSLSQCGVSRFDKVVLTVPVSTPLNGVREKIMREAAMQIGLEKIDIIKESDAAGYALLKEDIHKNAKYLVYDFGGGTFDVSLIEVRDEQIGSIGAVGSDSRKRWGGIYIDNLIRNEWIRTDKTINTLAEKLRRPNAVPFRELFSIRKLLRDEPISAKINLLRKELYKFPTGDYVITRRSLEDLSHNMVQATIDECIRLLEFHNVKVDEIDAVYLVGGSSRLNLVKKMWEEERKVRNAKFKLIDSAKLDVVSQGASLYNIYKISEERLIELGKEKVRNGKYDEARLMFEKANDKGFVYLGLLYYSGVLGDCNYRKAFECFRIQCDDSIAKLFGALMYFQGLGVEKNDTKAYEILADDEFDDVYEALRRVLSARYAQSDLDLIYSINALNYIVL
ncbi:MAG: Hsp70 family protein [Muribaculaceae bacterium]|nr:Hsp70 family protein [Muribaculaceae bacterium]